MAFCTVTDVESILSELGVTLHADDFQPASESDDAIIASMIERAEQDMMFYLFPLYDQATLEGNLWVKWACATLAAFRLTTRRGNSAPASLQVARDEYLEQLRAVKQQEFIVPGVRQNDEHLPTMSNIRVDSRFRDTRIRVQPVISAGDPVSKRPQFTDHAYEGSTLFIF